MSAGERRLQPAEWPQARTADPSITIEIPFTDVQQAIDINALMAPMTAAIIGLTLT